MRSAKCSELLVESEACRAKSLEVQSAESRPNVVPNTHTAQADVNLDQALCIYIYLFIYLDVCTDHNDDADIT